MMNDSAPKQEPPYGLRMPPDLKDRVKAAAKASNRSMNAEIVATLEEKYPKFSGEEKFFKAAKEMEEAIKLLEQQGGNSASKDKLDLAREAINQVWLGLDMTEGEFLRARYPID